MKPNLNLEQEIGRLIRLRSKCLAGRDAARKGAELVLRFCESFPVRRLDQREFD